MKRKYSHETDSLNKELDELYLQTQEALNKPPTGEIPEFKGTIAPTSVEGYRFLANGNAIYIKINNKLYSVDLTEV